ncbi:MAG: hypothetical protein ACM359_10205 [Bacillota bacterium]
MLDLTWPKILLGGKEANPTAWRILNDVLSGKTKRPQKKTLEMVGRLISTKMYGSGSPIDVLAVAQQMPDGYPWETSTAMWNAGLSAAGGEPFLTVATEAVRMERIAYAAGAAAKRGDLQAALNHILGWDMNMLPCQQWIIAHIDTSGTPKDFGITSAPLAVVATLYLWACWVVDFFGPEVPPTAFSIIPEQRGDRIIRPMRRWLEGVKAQMQIRTIDGLADFLLHPRTRDEDVEGLRRQVRKWWQKGEIPAWSRVRHITWSMSKALGADRSTMENELQVALAAIRFLDQLLAYSLAIRDQALPEYDPLAPFRDYPQMRRHAAEVKAALPSEVRR